MSSGILGRARVASVVAVLLIAAGLAGLAGAEAPANDAFQRTWARTDKPVADLAVDRTWMWGPQANTGALEEDYAEAPNGKRTVQYYDKSRMEDNSWRASQAPWDVTNGLLVVEMVDGKLQTGDAQFEDRVPAEVNIAGDPGEHPTYADVAAFDLRNQPATLPGTSLTTWVDATGILLSGQQPPVMVTAAERVTVPGIDHTVASVFWDFMHSTGTVHEDGQNIQASLFLNPFYATGYPITEAYWSAVRVGGTPQSVLWQCFERRCLTYNPVNSPGWQVEAGNVGQHYYAWRSGSSDVTPTVTATAEPTQPGSTTTPTATATSTTDPGQPTQTATPSQTPTVTPTPTAETFGDGTWIVGRDIEAGTYRSSGGSGSCYWERLSGFGGTLDDIIANDSTSGRAVVAIEAGDEGFRSTRCGTWSSDLSPITTSQTASFGDGTWIVGVDIAPGTWRNDVSDSGCYWERVSDFSGDTGAIIGSGDVKATGIKTVTIIATDAGFKTWDCGNWTRIGN